MKKILNIAHRGASAYAPENTVESIEMAIQLGADMVEFDLRRTADGVIVLWHDEMLEIGEGGTSRIAEVDSRNLESVALKRGFRLARFDEVLREFGSRIAFDIEIKVRGFEEEIVRLLGKYPPLIPSMVSSFHPGVVRTVKRLNPMLNTALVVGKSRIYKVGHLGKTIVKRLVLRSGVDSVHLNLGLISPPLLNELTGLGLSLYIWTVDEKRDMEKLIDMGIDGLISNKPDLVKGVIKSYGGVNPESNRMEIN